MNSTLDALEQSCRAFEQTTGPDAKFVAIEWSTEARYPDQAWEIEVPLRKHRFGVSTDIDDLLDDFHNSHQEIFAVSDPHSPIETVGWSATIRCRIGSPCAGRIRAAPTEGEFADRRVYFGATGWIDAKVQGFEKLSDGDVLEGPAIVESSFTSIVIDPGARARRDATGALIIDVGE